MLSGANIGGDEIMNHKGTVTLETERIILRRFEQTDAEGMFRNWASDPEVFRHMTFPHSKTLEEVQKSLEGIGLRYDKLTMYYWAIVPKTLNEPIGFMMVVDINESVKSVEVGYIIGKDFWNKGYMTEALSAVIKFLFEDVRVNRIAAIHDHRNPASGIVMRKCGMTYEGTNRQSGMGNEGIHDQVHYAILAEDYFGVVQK